MLSELLSEQILPGVSSPGGLSQFSGTHRKPVEHGSRGEVPSSSPGEAARIPGQQRYGVLFRKIRPRVAGLGVQEE